MVHETPALVLRDCAVLDGLGNFPTAGDLWIAGGRIIEPHAAPVGGVRSLGGRVVMAGLIDAHVHLCLDGGPDPLVAYRAATAAQVMERMRANAAHTLQAGVTTVRDLGAPTPLILQLRAEIAAGLCPGPRVLASGAPITSPGGHVHEMGGAVRGPDELRRFVRGQHEAGTDLIKIMVTGGGLSPQTDPRTCQFTDDEIVAVAQAARAAALPVAAHAHADVGVRQAVAAGVQSIEHGSYTASETLAMMQSAGTALVPTLLPAIAALSASLASERRRAIADRFEARQRVAAAALRAGVRIAAGTDAGVAFTPHGAVAAEVRALVACGIPAMLALAAAGREAAAVAGRRDLGVLVPGASADLIVLDADPLGDLSTLSTPWAVMRRGEWVRLPQESR